MEPVKIDRLLEVTDAAHESEKIDTEAWKTCHVIHLWLSVKFGARHFGQDGQYLSL
jgi:hypothetical protein